MDVSVIALIAALIALFRSWSMPTKLEVLQEELTKRQAEQARLQAELQRLRTQLTSLQEAASNAPPVTTLRPVIASELLRQPDPVLPVRPAPTPAEPPLPRPVVPIVPVVLPVPVAPLVPPTPVAPVPAVAPTLVANPPLPLPPPPRWPVLPIPTGPTWWERASTVLLENWTGILGAVVLVTGVGFLGIYAALRMAPPFRFLLICAFAGGLLGVRFALRDRVFAQKLNAWLLSSAAAIFLFACVGAVSIAGLRWATSPVDYLLLLTGVSANLYLAWRASREEVATLHGVLSLVALAVLPPTAVTLGAAAGVTAFSIAITYRQLWKYQLLLSIASFFAFHLYWHQQLAVIPGGLRLVAMGLVLLVGGAAAVVQYRSVYAQRRFEPFLFAAHVLNWTCLGISLYIHSTGSVWKTIPLALGSGLTFWAGRQAKQLGIGWLFQTDTIISLILALATALSLQGWHATPSIILLFMLLESLLVALIMARQSEALVYRVALTAAGLAGAGLLLLAGGHLAYGTPTVLYRDALMLVLAGWAGLGFMQLAFRQPLLQTPDDESVEEKAAAHSHRELLGGLVGLAGLLQVGAGVLLMRALFGWSAGPVAVLLVALLALAGSALGLAAWVRSVGLAPSWMRRQQLVLGQFFVVLTVFGLHQTGLSWPGVLVVLYAENLLVAVLLSGRDEEDLRHAQTYLLVVQAMLLPVLVRYTSPGTLGNLGRAALLLGAVGLTVAYQARRLVQKFKEPEFATLSLGAVYRLPALGPASGWLLLGAGTFEYAQPWAAWAMVGLLGVLLVLHQRAAVPGLWAGLVLASVGYMVLQWSHLLSTSFSTWEAYQPRYLLLYLLPAITVPVAGLLVSWWPTAKRYVRGPWLYLLGAHLVVALVAAVPPHHYTYLMLGLLTLASAAFSAAIVWRHTLPETAAVLRAGQPDRYLLHLSYGLLISSLLAHLRLLAGAETILGQPAEYFTATLFFGVLAALAVARPPATEPIYTSWRGLHPWLPEVALLFGTLTLAHNLRAPWLPLLWVSMALILSLSAAHLPARFRRLGVYGRLYYGLAAVSASVICLMDISPSQLLSLDWWALVAAVALLFGYVGLTLHGGNASFASLSPAWDPLARPSRRQFEAWLLYPAFVALSLLLIQSFDRSVLTVLLMLEVVAVFSTSLLLRRQDLRYVALAGMLGCLVRLVFFDLSRSGSITRAIVFIFMGLLLLGMNALYARFKTRFAPNEELPILDDAALEAEIE